MTEEDFAAALSGFVLTECLVAGSCRPRRARVGIVPCTREWINRRMKTETRFRSLPDYIRKYVTRPKIIG
jgi:hypothetical protein